MLLNTANPLPLCKPLPFRDLNKKPDMKNIALQLRYERK